MSNLLHFNRDPDPEPGFAETISTALDAPEGTPEATPLEKAPETPPAWDGKTERRKIYEGEKRRASDKVDPDPEHELDFELEAGKGKAKLKLSDLKETAKWIHENKGTLASMLKHREMAAKYPEFGKAMNTLIEKSFTGNDLNKEFVDKTLAVLEGKAEKTAEKIEEKDELIEEMQKQLEDLDPDSPQAAILKKSIAYQEGLKAEFKKQLGESQKRIEVLETKLNAVDKTYKDFLSEQGKAEQNVEVKRLSELYKKEIGALTEKNTFMDEDERREFDAAVRNGVAVNSKDVKDDTGFVKLIQATAKAVYDKMSKRRESIVNDYLKKKGQPPKKEDEPPKKKTEDEDPLKGKTMGEAIADEMFSGTT